MFVRFAAATGMRRGEIVALRWSNVNLDEEFVQVAEAAVRVREIGQIISETKSETSNRRIWLDEGTVILLRTHRAQQNEYMLSLGELYTNHDFVFANLHGNMLDLDHISQSFKRIAVKAGLPNSRLHDLRHFSASVLMANGANPVVVKERMGHSSAAFTLSRYGHGFEADHRAAAKSIGDLFTVNG